MSVNLKTLNPILILASFVLCSNVSAQNNPDELEEIVVQGRYLSLDKLNSVKTPTPILDVPQSLSIFSKNQIWTFLLL